MKGVLLVIVAASLIAAGCRGQSQKKKNKEKAETQQAGKFIFPYVDPPATMIDNSDMQEYAMVHFWDKFDFSDERALQNKDQLEQALVNYYYYLSMAPDELQANGELRKTMDRADANPQMYDFFIETADKYLYEPNSPMMNEELYIAVLESQVENERLEDIYKVAPRERLMMANKNRPGMQALDFPYSTAGGGNGTLYGIKADYTILFFYNLGCAACRDVRERLTDVLSEPSFEKMMAQGKLKVLALYPDSDITEWYKYRADIPAEWINGYDAGQVINDRELYDLKAIPTLYLLGKDKKVILKDFIAPEMLSNVIR